MAASSKKQIAVIVNAMEGVAESVIKKLTLDAVANLTKAPQEGGTPIDTGWARANWIARVSAPQPDVVGSPESVDKGTQQAALGSILAYKLASGPVFITNNVPYILALNANHKTSAGFVQRAIQLAVTQLRGIAA
mgnify:FL=1